MKQYVIVGNGVAAAGCIEGIRSADKTGRIVVVSEETHAVYCRPLISYYLEGKTDLARMGYRPDDFYARMGCEVLYGRRAVAIDAAQRALTLDDGGQLPYDSLCVATGSSPFVPGFDNLGAVKNRFSFQTLDDALALEKAVDRASRVLIVGAGLIGLKCAEGLRDRVQSITVCDLADRVLSSILDSDCAAIVQRHLESNGLRFLLGDSVARFEENSAHMQSGKTVPFDMLVLAVGVRANSALIKDAGGETNRGILVDDRMQTSLPNVYAAGDCAEGYDVSLGARRVLALLPNAYMQGACAGRNMAGANELFDKAIPMNAIGFFGLHMMTAGSYFTPEQGGEVYADADENSCKKLFTRSGLLTGFILLGRMERAGIYTSMIREKVPLNTVDFDLLKQAATSAAFSAEKRSKMFGGVV